MVSNIKMNKKVVIRSMEPEDIYDVLDIDRKLSGARRAMTYKDMITGDLGGELDLSFVAEVDDKIAGFVLARHVLLGDPIVETGLIQIFGIDPDFKRCGIATMLIEKLIAHCREKGPKAVKIMVNQTDNELSQFFTNVGFNRGQLVEYTIDC
jgi:ribosomal protein S18 acetylase RimI-like enzyme